MQFVYHASSLGMGTEEFTDMSMANATAGTGMEGVNRPTPKMQRRARSPRVQANVAVTASAAGQASLAANQAGSSDGQTGSAANQTTGLTASTAGQTGFAAIQTTRQKGQAGSTTDSVPDSNVAVVDQTSSATGKPVSSFVAAKDTDDAGGGFHSGTLDIFKEIDELMGGVEAMVSEVNIGTAAMGEQWAEVDEGSSGEEDEEHRVISVEIERPSEPQWITADAAGVAADTTKDISFPTDLPPPVGFDHAEPRPHFPLSSLAPNPVQSHTVSAASLGSSPAISRGSLEAVTPPTGFSGGEEEEENRGERVREPANDTGRPEIEIRVLPEAEVEIRPEIVVSEKHSSDPSSDHSAGTPERELPVSPSAEEYPYPEDNLAGVSRKVAV